ncbi:MAG: hypothetical protein F3739_03350 [Nitrospinae bacterium]|nr:hypothetical protein [Nitrospinota bacterium]
MIKYLTNKTDLDFSQYNLVVDCTDNLKARLEIAKRSISARVKLVTASVIQEQGYISTLNPTLDKFACNHCFFEDWSGESREINCSTEGVISTAVAMIASIQATECLKAMTNGENNTNTIIHVNTWDLSTSKIAYSKNPACQI